MTSKNPDFGKGKNSTNIYTNTAWGPAPLPPPPPRGMSVCVCIYTAWAPRAYVKLSIPIGNTNIYRNMHPQRYKYACTSNYICIRIYIYICRLIMAHAVCRLQGTALADGPYSVHRGVCNTPQCLESNKLASGGWCEATRSENHGPSEPWPHG